MPRLVGGFIIMLLSFLQISHEWDELISVLGEGLNQKRNKWTRHKAQEWWWCLWSQLLGMGITQTSRKKTMPHTHGSVENGCISKMMVSFLIALVVHWTTIMGLWEKRATTIFFSRWIASKWLIFFGDVLVYQRVNEMQNNIPAVNFFWQAQTCTTLTPPKYKTSQK